MKIKKIAAGVLAVNCYICFEEQNKEAFILDPGGDADAILEAIKELDAKVSFVLLTHGHFDHTGAAVELSKYFNVPIYINKKDMEFIEKRDQLFIMNGYENDINILFIDEASTFNIGKLPIKCIFTPGHTSGGMCYLIDNILFSGDTLFDGSIGRTDFVGGNYETLLGSIREKLLILSEDIVVLPGHGSSTTIGREKTHNPFLNFSEY
jgi:hydroxyacylglutathione hydrolase